MDNQIFTMHDDQSCSYFFLWFCSYFFIVWSKNVTLLIFIVQNQFVDRKWFSKTALCESKTSLTASRQCASQKRHSRGVPFFKLREEKNSKQKWEEKKSQNLTEEGSRMTSGMFGPKTLPTRGPDWPQGCSVQKRYQRGVPNDFRDVRSKNVTNAGSRTTF